MWSHNTAKIRPDKIMAWKMYDPVLVKFGWKCHVWDTPSIAVVSSDTHYRSRLAQKCHVWDTSCIAGVSSRSLSLMSHSKMSCLRYTVDRWCIITLMSQKKCHVWDTLCIAGVSSRSLSLMSHSKMSCLRYTMDRWCIITLIIAHVSIKNVMFEIRRVSLVYHHAHYRSCLTQKCHETRCVSLVYLHTHYRSCLARKCHVWDTPCVAVYRHTHYRSCLAQCLAPKCHVWDTPCIAVWSSRSLSLMSRSILWPEYRSCHTMIFGTGSLVMSLCIIGHENKAIN
jgi:hypothetical protein